MGEGARDAALAGAGRTNDEDDLVVADPVTAGEAEHDGLVEAAERAEVDVLDGGIEPQLGELA